LEDEQISEGFGTGGASVRAGRQAHGSEQLAELVDLAPRGRVGRIEREAAGQHRDQPAGAGQRQRFEDEVVVQAVAARVVPGVVQAHVGERHVPDGGVEEPVRQPGVRERLAADLGLRVKRGGDPRVGRIELDPRHLRAIGRERDEHARASARLQHAPVVEAELRERPPDLAGDRRVGVVRVDRRAPGGRPPLRVQQFAQLLAQGSPLLAPLVEELRDGAPAAPPCQQPLLIRRGGPLIALQRAERAQGLEVGLDTGALT
jgi:hypothetical protein